jgi:hypothetical protein
MVIRLGETYVSVSRELARALSLVPLALPVTLVFEAVATANEVIW